MNKSNKPGKGKKGRGSARKKDYQPRDENGIWHPPPGERDDGESIRRRVEWIKQYLGVPDLCRLTNEIDRFRETRLKMRPLPVDLSDFDKQLEEGEVEATTLDGRRLKASPRRLKEVPDTWGQTGRFVEVRSEESFASARLRFHLPEKRVSHLLPSTLRLARWDPERSRFHIVPQSEYDQAQEAVLARISKPGIYTALGLPRDPRLLSTLQMIDVMRPWFPLDQKEGRQFLDEICKVILCADFMQEVIQQEELLGRFGIDPGDFPGGFGGGDICEQCLGLDPGLLPEVDILDVVDVYEIPELVLWPLPWPWPWPWPKKCQKWVNIGPVNVTGRTGVLAIHPTNGNILYAGTTGGGVWRTSNAGNTWYARMSNELSLAIGGLAVAASNPNVLYAATGEWTAGIGWPVDPVIQGMGVYRTANAGGDWDLCAPIPSANCSAVAVDPFNPNRVFVAGELGLHRSTDGGASWDIPAGLVNGVFDGEVSDVVIDPNDIDRIYIGVHRDGVYRSLNGGTTWTRLQNGIDTGSVADAPKISLGRNGAHGSNFVAVKMGDRVYTSTNGGDTFTRQTDVGNPIWFTAWANVMAVDPDDEDILFAGASNLYRSPDGGNSWVQVGGYGTNVHPDMQSVVFDPTDHDHMYVANDGGVWESTNNGNNWNFVSRGLVATHFYVMGLSQSVPLRYGGSIQDDNGYAYDGVADWISLGAGEGGYVEYDPSNSQVIYHDAWFSQLRKTTNGGSTWSNLGIDTDTNYAEPLAIARTNTNLLLALQTSGEVARSTNGGNTWTNVLDPGVTFSAIKFAPSDDNFAYTGTTSGRIWLSTDSGSNWSELDTTALPNAKIQSIAVDHNNPRRLFVAFSGTGIRHLFRGDVDMLGNVTWFDVSGVLPAVSLPDLPLTGLVVHPSLDEVLYVSTFLGVLRSTDGGDSWAPFDEGLPNAFVSDLDFRESIRSIYASTMGRGIYRRYV